MPPFGRLAPRLRENSGASEEAHTLSQNLGNFGLFVRLLRFVAPCAWLVLGLGGARAADLSYPPAGVRFWLPDSWVGNDSTGVITASDPLQQVVFMLKAVPSQSLQEALAAFDAEMAQTMTGVQPLSEPRQFTVGGMQAYGVDARGFYQGTPVDMSLMVVQPPNGPAALVYVICESSQVATHRSDVERVLSSFSTLAGGSMQSPPPARQALGSGVVRYSATPPNDQNLAPFMQQIFDAPLFPHIASVISQSMALPRDLNILGQQCGELNAAYYPSRHSIELCYELAPFFFAGFIDRGENPQQAMENTANAMAFVLLHELGHGLIGELDIGVTGGEEDAADDFAALLLAEQNSKAAQDGALALLQLGNLSEELVFWDEHSFGEQRFYNILCVIYGSNPNSHSELVPLVLPPPRAQRCPEEYRRKRKGWDGILAPFQRN